MDGCECRDELSVQRVVGTVAFIAECLHALRHLGGGVGRCLEVNDCSSVCPALKGECRDRLFELINHVLLMANDLIVPCDVFVRAGSAR